eukprot:CAMPEP_0181105022 /NCGR_PEP_ID=MMETSP1071-20121207/15743_1 /TAXON_ID=35127 /ORGANISM="Thalassiosira sp., Strain NH16" /LENGTH=267 /DNA_ID=CAMNT_0023188267 /DNA_START=92 /DNA_END=895 /DNA_ORIENTATION=+
MVRSSIFLTVMASSAPFSAVVHGYAPARLHMTAPSPSSSFDSISSPSSSSSRRGFVSKSVAFALGTTTVSIASTSSVSNTASMGGVANAVGPIKIDIVNPTYQAAPCPKDRPIPGEKAMKGMRGLCVTVKAELAENSPKELDKVGVYGYVDDSISAESVLANNPDSGTDAGQFAMIPTISTTDKKIEFEFIAAVPMEKDLSQFEDGIGPLAFKSLRVISFPGGQQYGAISPCEFNEFSEECEVWEEENGPYKKADFMIKSNPRTKGY